MKAIKIRKFPKNSLSLAHSQAKTTKRDTQTGAGDRPMPYGDRRMAMGDTNY
uniref:hypothetical protein n=1 Tax=Ornithobacterium rhinotracheale TaxID=28251 RepID=UPI0039A66577